MASYVCFGLLICVYLAGIGDMIYTSIRVNKAKTSIDTTIGHINDELYPNEIATYLFHIDEQIRHLDEYCSRSKSYTSKKEVK
jgi:hypothetical protein